MSQADVVHKLTYALKDMVRVAQRAPEVETSFGPPCSHLIDVIMDRGLEAVAEEIVQIGEFRLNGAGLKICYRNYDEAVVIPEYDQYRYYPVTGPKLKEILANHGLQGQSQDSSSPIIGRRSIRY